MSSGMKASRWGNKHLAQKPGIVCLMAMFLVSLPFWADEYITTIFIQILLYMSLGHMWNLLAGYTGLVSLGQQMFIGLGGYSLAVITEVYHLPMLLGIFTGGLVSVLFAWLISHPIFKMRGVYFTIGTWIAAEALAVFFSNWTFVRSGQGFNITISYGLSTGDIYFVALAAGAGSMALVFLLLRSRIGLALMAMRDNEHAAEAIGIDLYRTKLMCFLLAAFVTGITGGAFYLSIAYIQPFAAFGIDWTVAMVFMVIIGGIGTMEGPVIGAAFYVLMKQYLYAYPGISMILLGTTAIGIILLAPKGIMGMVQERYGLDLVSVRRWSKEG